MAEASSAGSSSSGQTGCWLVVGAVGLLALLGQCISSQSDEAEEATTQFSQTIGNSISLQEPEPVQPLSTAGVKVGLANVRSSMDAEGLSGAMIFSQNCYDGLTHDFAWKRLDTCGAADLLAVQSAESSYDAPTNEAAYFDSEAAAGRYLEAATKAGQDPSEADLRLETLRSRVINSTAPKPTPADEQTEASDPVIWDEIDEADG